MWRFGEVELYLTGEPLTYKYNRINTEINFQIVEPASPELNRK